MAAIGVVASGQLVSQIGSAMTSFAILYWAWQETGQATNVTLLGAFSFGPLYLLTPLAGALVDRWDRKLVMMASDLAEVLASATILLLLHFDRLGFGALLALTAFSGAFRAFQVPAYGAAVTTMVHKRDYARVSGILSLPQSTALVVAPSLAGALLGPIGLEGILVVDVLTFGVAVACLATISVPAPPASEGVDSRRGLGSEMLFGWHYIRRRPPLLGILATLFFFNFAFMLPISLMPPLILARTGNDELVLGLVQSLFGIGGLLGAAGLGIWGGSRRRIQGVLTGIFASSLFAGLAMGLGRTPLAWCLAAFFGSLTLPVLNGCSQAIWQSKVAPDVQGRVFAIRRVLSQSSALPAFLVAGPLTDWVVEPAMRPGGAWAPVFGGLVGTGPGAGISLIFVAAGLLGMAIAVVAYSVDQVRLVEALLPDHAGEGEGS
jgi:MFS family permease